MSEMQEDSTWGEVQNLGVNVNSVSWDSHPALSHTGDTLYFASDRLGGFGLADIYFTYKDGEQYVLMDMESYEETRLNENEVGDRAKYLNEGMDVTAVFWGEKVIEVELPSSIVLEVVETDPGVKGDTATGGTKPAIVEGGAQIMVPLFISTGERIKIDTRTDKYLGRE